MSLGERIQQLRKASGLSQEQLAEMIGVSRQAISKWETDQSAPEIEKVVLLSKTFSISTDELLGNELPNNTERNDKIPANRLADVLKLNMRKRQLTIGWMTAAIGCLLLIIEYFSLIIIQFNQQRFFAATGYYANPMEYAKMEPMPIIFMLTIAIIVAGIVLAAFSLFHTKRGSSRTE